MEREGDAERSGTPASRHVQFRLYAPEAHRVSVAGDFNGWDVSVHELSLNENDLWLITIELPPARHAYKFFVDGEWKIDPDASSYITDPYGTLNSIIIVE